MRALFRSLLLLAKVGHFAWMAGWGAWLLWITWCLAFGGSFWMPFTSGGFVVNYGVWWLAILMLIFGLPLGLAVAHFSSVVLRLPGAAICTAIARRPGNEDLMEISRRYQR